MELNLISSLAVAVVSICGVLSVFALDNDFGEVVREKRAMRIPPCDRCAHYRVNGRAHCCVCPSCIEFASRRNGLTVESASAILVRGTKHCKFEPEGGGE